MADFTLVEQHW